MAFSTSHAVEFQRVKVVIKGYVVLDTMIHVSDDDVVLDLSAPTPANIKASPKKSKVASTTSSSSSAEETVKRCAATTRKGTRCSRNAQPGSNYCWQHQR